MIAHASRLFKQVTTAMTITTAGAKDANDFIGVDSTCMTFAGCASLLGGCGRILSGMLIDGDLQSANGELWLFTVAPAGLPADGAAFTLTDAQAAYAVGYLKFVTYVASALNSVCIVAPPGELRFKCADTSKDLYGAFVTRGTPTYVTAIPRFILNIEQDA
jgi:hypothetical protein